MTFYPTPDIYPHSHLLPSLVTLMPIWFEIAVGILIYPLLTWTWRDPFIARDGKALTSAPGRRGTPRAPTPFPTFPSLPGKGGQAGLWRPDRTGWAFLASLLTLQFQHVLLFPARRTRIPTCLPYLYYSPGIGGGVGWEWTSTDPPASRPRTEQHCCARLPVTFPGEPQVSSPRHACCPGQNDRQGFSGGYGRKQAGEEARQGNGCAACTPSKQTGSQAAGMANCLFSLPYVWAGTSLPPPPNFFCHL